MYRLFVVSYGRNVPINANYNLKQCILAGEESYNDLGVKFDTKLKFDSHINEKVNKAYSIFTARQHSLLC